MLIERSFLRAIPDHHGRCGAFATRWEGWCNPRDRQTLHHHRCGRVNNCTALEARGRIERRMGVYAFLWRTSVDSEYVLYVGKSNDLQREVDVRARGFEAYGDARVRVAVCYVSSDRTTVDYEDDLIRWYCPPWNKRFYKTDRC